MAEIPIHLYQRIEKFWQTHRMKVRVRGAAPANEPYDDATNYQREVAIVHYPYPERMRTFHREYKRRRREEKRVAQALLLKGRFRLGIFGKV